MYVLRNISAFVQYVALIKIAIRNVEVSFLTFWPFLPSGA